MVSAVLCWRFLASRETLKRKLPIDIAGLGLLVVWVGALQIMLDTGKDADWFASPQIVVLAIVALVVFVAFVIWEATAAYPIVDLTLFKHWNFALGTIAFCLGYAIFFANTLLFPLWLQTHVGYTATWAGLVAAPSGAVAVIFTPIATRIMSRFDMRWSASLAFVAFATSYFMRANLTADASFLSFTLPLFVQGIAISTFFVSMVAISLDGVEMSRIPSASGISNFSRITAGGFAASIITTMWDRREALHQSRMVEIPNAFNPTMRRALAHLTHHGVTVGQSYALVMHNLVNQAYLLASEDLFWVSAWLSLAMLGVVWLARRSLASGAVAGGE